MIKVRFYDNEDSKQILDYIHILSQELIRNNMDKKLCHQHSDFCNNCDLKDFCYECEEIEVWSKNYSVKMTTSNN